MVASWLLQDSLDEDLHWAHREKLQAQRELRNRLAGSGSLDQEALDDIEARTYQIRELVWRIRNIEGQMERKADEEQFGALLKKIERALR